MSVTTLATRFNFEAFYRAEFSKLVMQIRARFGAGPPEPEDAVQRAFAKLAEQLESDARVADPRAYVYTAARNAVIDGKRRVRTRRSYIETLTAQDYQESVENLSPERVVEGKDRLNAMNRLIEALPEKQRTILALSRLEGLTYAEIASRTGYSLADISRQLKAALITLRDGLEKADAS